MLMHINIIAKQHMSTYTVAKSVCTRAWTQDKPCINAAVSDKFFNQNFNTCKSWPNSGHWKCITDHFLISGVTDLLLV